MKTAKVNIVVPMAGAGSRFATAGYNVPKPFISFMGKMMVEHVLEGLVYEGASYTLIIQETFLTDNQAQLEALASKFPVNFLTVKMLTQGAAATALAAHRLVNDDTPVVFADSDNIFNPGVVARFLDDAQTRKLDGSLLTFESHDPRFSFIETDENGVGLRTREKEAISSHAICGVYYFGQGKDFVDCAIEAMIYGTREKGEFYMSGLYNGLIGKNKKVGFYEIDNNEWDCVGTPDQLDAYLASKST